MSTKEVEKIFREYDIRGIFGQDLTQDVVFNIGRLLPQTFFYTYAFSRLKDKVFGDT